MSSGFWYPYLNAEDAAARLGKFVNHTHGRGCGITWSDGYHVTVLRQPQMVKGHGTYLNVFRRHIAAPKPAHARIAPQTFLQRAGNFFVRAVEIETQTVISEVRADAQVIAKGAHAVAHWAHDDVWEPAHRWLLRHKKTADGLGVAVDIVGVAAAVVFVVTLGPEIGAVALVTGAMAGVGSVLLLAVDGTVFGSEMLGHKEWSEHFENSPAAQWTRIVATGMTLLDLPVGGTRAVVSVGKIGHEIEEGTAALAHSKAAAAAAEARVGKIRNPLKHPEAVARRTRQAKRLAAQVEHQHYHVRKLSRELARTKYFDVPAAVGATPAGAALLSAAPPALALSKGQRQRDEDYLASLQPRGGMPKDVKLEMRISTVGKTKHD